MSAAEAAVRVAVVGAGPAGLCAARYSLAAGMEVTVFEQSDAVGGTWQYTDRVGSDSYGVPIHTSMYRNLRINVPKEVMTFPGFPHKESNMSSSYVTSGDILQYLNDFADSCDLRRYCKLNHHVKRIRRTSCGWEVTVVDLPNDKEVTYTFDALFICNGLNNRPYTPHMEGSELFSGLSLHSHDYRMPEPYTGQRVLIIGGGPSALDLTNHVSNCADKVFFSHHSDRFTASSLTLRENVVLKPDVRRLGPRSVEFKDDTVEDVDTVIYCTGYKCNYTFLDDSCGITEDDGLVYPLYKHFINANHTSMCILGNMCHSMQFPTFDIQVRFFIKSLTDGSFLPSKEAMLEDIKEHAKKKLEDGKPKKMYFTSTAEEDAEYYSELANIAGIEPVPKVLSKIYARAISQLYQNFPLFRGDTYQIINEESFIVSQ